MPISQYFRVATEGATTDGRQIERSHIVDMAKNYSPQMYGARVNLEHYVSPFPDSVFKIYGDVKAVKAEEIKDGPLKGKMGLYAQVDATEDLVKLHAGRQKVFTSIELHPKFADTGEAYLMGLAFTDNPASLGGEMMKFSANNAASPLAARKYSPDTWFTAAEETEIAYIADPVPEPEKPNLFTKVKEMFSKKSQTDNESFNDVHKAVELVAEHQQAIESKFAALPDHAAEMTALKTEIETQKAEFTELKTKLNTTDRSFTTRPPATGGETTDAVTDC